MNLIVRGAERDTMLAYLADYWERRVGSVLGFPFIVMTVTNCNDTVGLL